jgi:hypothetical protein
LILDGCGILLVAPTLIFVGWHFGDKIEDTILALRKIEQSILWGLLALSILLICWYWLRLRTRRNLLVGGPRETFVEQTKAPSPDTTEATAPASEAGPEPASEAKDQAPEPPQ